jgi:biotin operon repressor
MTRSLADLPNEDIKGRDQLAAELGNSRAAILGMIVRWYL